MMSYIMDIMDMISRGIIWVTHELEMSYIYSRITEDMESELNST